MAADLDIALILRMVDRATAPMRPVLAQIERINQATETGARRSLDWSNRQVAAVNQRRDAMRGEALSVAATGYAFYQALRPAVDFETAMSGVRRVVEFQSPQGLADLQNDILALTSSGGLPMAAEGVAAIIEAAGQAGIVDAALPDEERRRQLIQFAQTAGQMGVAFDISAERAGEAMAQWRTRMALSNEEAANLGDMINHLSNSMAASAPDMVDVIGRQGGLARTAGLALEEIAALSAAFVASAPSSEIAATGMQNFLLTLSSGEAMTDRQEAVLNRLGLQASDLAQIMQIDATSGIMSVLEALSGLEDHERTAALAQLFGRESIGAIAPLLTNLDMLRGALSLVGEDAEYTGSMFAEFQAQSSTFAAMMQLLQNFGARIGITAGGTLLPILKDMATQIMDILAAIGTWAEQNPELVRTILLVTAGLVGLKLATFLAGWAFLGLVSPILQILRALSYMGIAMTGKIATLTRMQRVLRFLLLPLRLVTGAVRLLGAVMLANPILAIITAIALGASLIYNNWDGIVDYFSEKIDRVSAAFDEGLLNGVLALLAEFNPFTMAVEGLQALLGELMEFLGVPDDIVAAFTEIDLFEAGANLVASLWQGLRDRLPAMIAWVSDLLRSMVPNWMQDAFVWARGQAGEPGQLSPENYTNPVDEFSGIDGTNDHGGVVRAGALRLVGERMPELFIPDAPGRILPGEVLARIARAREGLDAAASRIDRRPAARLQPEHSPTGSGLHIGAITINAGSAAHPDEIARALRRELEQLMDRQRRTLHDGASYG